MAFESKLSDKDWNSVLHSLHSGAIAIEGLGLLHCIAILYLTHPTSTAYFLVYSIKGLDILRMAVKSRVAPRKSENGPVTGCHSSVNHHQ